MHYHKRCISIASRLLISITCIWLLSACLDTPADDPLPPFEEEISEDGGFYEPETPIESTSYGSGSGSGSGQQKNVISTDCRLLDGGVEDCHDND